MITRDTRTFVPALQAPDRTLPIIAVIMELAVPLEYPCVRFIKYYNFSKAVDLHDKARSIIHKSVRDSTLQGHGLVYIPSQTKYQVRYHYDRFSSKDIT